MAKRTTKRTSKRSAVSRIRSIKRRKPTAKKVTARKPVARKKQVRTSNFAKKLQKEAVVITIKAA